MNIIVPIKLVPDLVEELELNDDGTDLDRDWLDYKINEFDEHAIEEALLLKDEHGAHVTIIALDAEDIDKPMYTAVAKGADQLVKITGDFDPDEPMSVHQAAKLLADAIKDLPHDLIFTGVQAVDDRDGQTGILLAHYLGEPHVSVVTSVQIEGGKAIVTKEYAGGVSAEFEADFPLVVGIQAARETPRYAPVSKVRRAMKSTEIEEVDASDAEVEAGSHVSRMFKPESGEGAQMIDGEPEEIAEKLVSILKEKSII